MTTVPPPTMAVVLGPITSSVEGNTKKSAASNVSLVYYAAAALAETQI
jgi:hypothetical protein